jgi:carbamoyltransferase
MITWGISANSHNAAVAVFDKDKLVFASDSERFSKNKNDADLHVDLIDHIIQFGEPSRVVWYEKPWLKTLRQVFAGQGLQDNNVARYLKKYNIDVPIRTVTHHHSHAAAGYYTSGFGDACVLVTDAIGEFECLTQWDAQGNELNKFSSTNYPHSLGLFYSALTQRCGLKPNEEEYILMGMSALGDPDRLYKDLLNDFVILNDDALQPFRSKENLHRGCQWWRPELTTEQDIYDIAAAAQKVYESAFEHVLKLSAKTSRSKNLVLMGGCALNCSANPIALKYFENVWIMPAPGDNGSAIGSVLAVTRRHIHWPGPYLGYDMGYSASDDEIVDYLSTNKICGLARGPAEFGPRALGNRSLLADPRDVDIKDRVNEIKHREKFRPFAPAILEELADQYFEMPVASSPYMQYTVKCKQPDRFPGIVHADGTSRIQTVGRSDDARFRMLLEKWYAKTSCPMLLNTSLNIKGEPMVNDRKDAIRWQNKYSVHIFT